MQKIKLTQNKFAIVDDEDFEFLNQWKWCAHYSRKPWYAVRCCGRKTLFMHRVILGLLPDDNRHVDHIDGNGLDNRRCNLRFCNPSQNQGNTHSRGGASKYKGVYKNIRKYKDKEYIRWVALIGINDIQTYLGCFKKEEDAARVYDKAALKHFGEFARTNL